MKCAVIQRPSEGTLRILRRKVLDSELRTSLEKGRMESIGIFQGSVMEILVASDTAEKAAGVTVGEVSGSCPQHIACLAVLGDTGAVRAAMDAVKEAVRLI